jgi:hypothetical protein
MSVWTWVGIGLFSWLMLSTVVGLLVAAFLRCASRERSVRLGGQTLVSALLTRVRSRGLSARS